MKYISFLILLSLVCFSSCKKEEPKNSDTHLPEVSKFSYYFIATIDGEEVKFEAKLGSGEYLAGPSSELYEINQFVDMYEGSRWEKNDDFPSRNKFYIQFLESRPDAEYPGFNYMMDMLQKKEYPFGKGMRNSETINGVIIRYHDSNGVKWESEKGSQDGSKFEVVELINESSAKTFRAHFNCKLYAGQQAKVLTNGTARGWYSPQKD